jgi:hypothetical protein
MPCPITRARPPDHVRYRGNGKVYLRPNGICDQGSLTGGVSNIIAHIVFGTPGTRTDVIRLRVIDVSDVKVFDLDEADMMDKDGLGDKRFRVKKCV